ncbi:MAG: hypothetical protein C4541_08110 [Candidatus Auribacter fodinae]|jgi:hypothetical protein|uniref:Uncharacterized protein n=1 Tax=Candidatus Auribacter fodinae TaxID=2093366 RepID=A0A3A4QWU6_9BACT|nr:MAG: hypothetical protein C4541_08110 [Candidatus Auribacter fodinae]
MVDLSMNRPIYLAQRDKYYLRAVNNLYDDFSAMPAEKRLEKVRLLVALFTKTRENALFAMRGHSVKPSEEHFDKCLELILDSLEAAHILIRHECLLSYDKSFLKQFLKQSLVALNRDVESIRESSNNIIERTRVLVRNLTERFETMRKEIFDDLLEDHKERYDSMFNNDDYE